jgi:hypothetical protein
MHQIAPAALLTTNFVTGAARALQASRVARSHDSAPGLATRAKFEAGIP